MHEIQDVQYTVVLVFPGFGEEREYAEQIVEGAIEHLNIPNYEPGFRFAPNVRAQLEVVGTTEQAYDKLESYDDLAMMILHDVEDDEKWALTAACEEKDVAVCHTFDAPERPRKRRDKDKGWTFELRAKQDDRPSAHQIPARSLIAPPSEDEEEMSTRIWQVIAVLAMGRDVAPSSRPELVRLPVPQGSAPFPRVR